MYGPPHVQSDGSPTLYGTGIRWSPHMYVGSPPMYGMIFFTPALKESTACPNKHILNI